MGISKQTAVKSALAASVFLMASPAFAASGKELINQGLELVGWMVWVVVAVAVAYGAWTTQSLRFKRGNLFCGWYLLPVFGRLFGMGKSHI